MARKVTERKKRSKTTSPRQRYRTPKGMESKLGLGEWCYQGSQKSMG